MRDERVKDPLGHYEATNRKADGSKPSDGLAVFGYGLGIVALVALFVGLLNYALGAFG